MKRLIVVYLAVLAAAIMASGCGKVATNGTLGSLPTLPSGVDSNTNASTSGSSGSIKSQLTCTTTSGTGSAQIQYNYQATTYSDGDQEIVCNQDNDTTNIEIIASGNVSANNGKCILGNSLKISSTYGDTFYLSGGNMYVQASGVGPLLMTCTTEKF